MKNKILLFLILLSSISFAQVSNGGEQEFDYGIKNNASTEIDSPPFLVSQGIDGTYGKMNRNNVIEYLEFASAVNLPVTGVAGKLYLTRDNNRLYRWNGTIYVEVTVDISGKENIANKQNSLAVDGTGVKFPTVDAVNAGLTTKQNTISGTTNVIPKFGTGGLVSSNITDNGTLVSTSTDITVNGLRVGRGSGNILTNVALGVGALNANTTGASNFALGESSLILNQTGNDNVGVGFNAIRNNISGIRNIGIGSQALFSNTGNFNIGIGRLALDGNTTGSNNVAIGNESGRFAADGVTANSISNSSIYLGIGTRALANNQTNQIVIATSGIGLGSNTTVIGNPSTLFGRWFGRLLLGTSTDNGVDQLQANGTISASPATLANQVVIKSQLDLKADLASPALTGTPTAPTATAGTNTTQIANTAFVQANSMALTGDQSLTGTKTITNNNTTIGRLLIQNSRTVAGPFGENFGLTVGNSGERGINVESSNGIGIRSFSNSGQAFNSTKSDSGIGLVFQTLNTTDTGDYISIDNNKIRVRANLTVKMAEFTVATLPTMPAGQTGYATVTDALAPTYLSTLTGGGTVKAPVFYDGTVWRSTINSDSVSLTGNQTIGGIKTFTNSVTANSFIKSGGTPSQFLKADGSVDESDVVKNIVKNATQGANITGTVSETILYSKLIPANTFKDGDFMNIVLSRIGKSGTNATLTHRIRINTSNTLTGSIQIATNTTTNTLNVCNLERTFSIKDNLLRGLNPTSNLITDIFNTSTSLSNSSFDPTVDNYIFITGQLSNSADTMYHLGTKITN